MKYKVGEIVYLKTDEEQKIRMVTGVLIRNNCYIYYLTNCTQETTHYDFEISSNVNELIKLIN